MKPLDVARLSPSGQVLVALNKLFQVSADEWPGGVTIMDRLLAASGHPERKRVDESED